MAPSIEGKRPEVKSPMNTTCCNREEITPRYRVTVVGSGNWGSVAAKLIASNTAKLPIFHDEVRMWVFEEILPGGEKLSKAINQTNENVKYLPGIKLGKNVIADPDLENAVKEANMLVFVTPHQFVAGICKRLVGKIKPNTEAISLIKGMEVKTEGPCMISKLITDMLGINCCIAVEKFSEATIGYRQDKEVAQTWARLFCTPYFLVSVAAIMRIGLREMRALSKLLFPSVRDSTFFESCGVADLITTCLGGRNRKVAEAFAKGGGKRSFDELEAELLGGQKLQGVSTAKEVYEILSHRGWQVIFPLFTTVHEICIGQLPSSAIVEYSEQATNFSIVEGLAQYC
ncbi:hypothetical protein C4D60_Mb09t01970 [Musa balbisiana]|uniref:Glycerol-3-phosphate dehydrogenase [NAD(+)] n=1 Tax=Musa balbisiana TaxID=52838 RepID=A0A4S8IDD7_MUSBA|nr:hypothetical protein C4D60_Mb09t01970 [Musa balbisiana]